MSFKIPHLSYRMMVYTMRLFKLPTMIQRCLSASQIHPGSVVLDYACGPGIFTIPAAKLVGPSGKVYAADIHPLAKEYTLKEVKKNQLNNVEFIQTDWKLKIPNDSIDTALLFDCYPSLKEPQKIIHELHRVLKPKGILAVDIHHINPEKPRKEIMSTNLFQLVENDANLASSEKQESFFILKKA